VLQIISDVGFNNLIPKKKNPPINARLASKNDPVIYEFVDTIINHPCCQT
jgi:hypothetical protein